jgi:hypothetical protein
VVGDVSGNTINFGSEHVFNSASTSTTSAAALTSTKFVASYIDLGNSQYGTAVVGDVSGTAITYGSEYVFNSASSYETSVAALSSNKFIVGYMNGGGLWPGGTGVVGDVTGNAITFKNDYTFNLASTWEISAVALTSNKFVILYRDDGNSQYGTGVVGEDLPSAPAGSLIIGTAKDSKTSGETLPVIIDGVSDVHSGLTQGMIYYVDDSGSLTQSLTPYIIGVAISSTEILLADPFY